MTQILLALVVVANLVVIFTKASACAARVNEIFDTTPSVTSGISTLSDSEDSKAPIIEFQNVSFSYHQNSEYALNNLNIQIYKGETVGIIGGTGSGKTTLISLIPRFYDPSIGKVLIRGKDVKTLDLILLRKMIGIVPQKAALFSGTVKENLRFGNQDASDEALKLASKISQASEFIENLPQGYDTEILQGGKNLSGGQKQRLTIARALACNPEILILDDSSSALDFATDARLRRSLKENADNMTVLLISQRANVVKSADKIIVLDDGAIAGIGKHEELFENCSVYREICLSQLKLEEVQK